VNIDKNILREQLKAAQDRRATGNVAYIKGDVALRILPFTDPETEKGSVARQFTQWRPRGEGKPIPHRGNWGKPDLFAKVEESETSFNWRKTNAYLVNAVEVSGNAREIRVWQLPSSVYEAICEILLDDDYDHALDLKKGVPFKIKRTGAGLSTEYSVIMGQKSIDVTNFAKQVVDPISAVADPGLERQSEALGVDAADFIDDEEEVEPVKAPAKKKPAAKVEEAEDEEDEEEEAEEEEAEETEAVYKPGSKASSARPASQPAKAASIRDLLKKGAK
jgi:hypothetical protein